MKGTYYRLNKKNEVEDCSWEQYCEDVQNFNSTRRINESFSEDKKIKVSTVFLALDHNGGMFETMLFMEDKLHIKVFDEIDEQERCHTYDDALKQHDKMCDDISKIIKQEFVQNA